MFPELPLPANLAAFVVSAAVIGFAGTRVARYADAIQARTGMGQAVGGMLLLGFITALPEASVTTTAAYHGHAQLAVNNLLGGLALNVAILAAADAAVRREALTAAVASVLPMLQAALLVLMLAIVAAGTLLAEPGLFGIGAAAWLLLAIYLLSVFVVRVTRGREGWIPSHADDGERDEPADGHRSARRYRCEPWARLVAKTGAAALAILAAGYTVAGSGERLAQQTGLGQSFFGAVFLALSTSLPEITVVFSSVRLGNYSMAVADVFGANLFCLTLLFVADAVFRGGPILAAAGRFGTFAALLAITLTSLFIVGLLERRHAMILRLGVDSLLILATYAAGVAILYRLR